MFSPEHARDSAWRGVGAPTLMSAITGCPSSHFPQAAGDGGPSDPRDPTGVALAADTPARTAPLVLKSVAMAAIVRGRLAE